MAKSAKVKSARFRAKFKPTQPPPVGEVPWLEEFVGYWKDDILQSQVEAREHYGTTDLVAILLADTDIDSAALSFLPRQEFLDTFASMSTPEVQERIADPERQGPQGDYRSMTWVFAAKRGLVGCLRLNFTEYKTDGSRTNPS